MPTEDRRGKESRREQTCILCESLFLSGPLWHINIEIESIIYHLFCSSRKTKPIFKDEMLNVNFIPFPPRLLLND